MNYEQEYLFHERLAKAVLVSSIFIFVLLYFVVPAPWGKTLSLDYGPLIPARLSWFLFEVPNLFWCCYCWLRRPDNMPAVNQLLLSLFALHYVNRAVVYPLRLSGNTKPIPAAVCLSGFSFTGVNGYLQARGLCQFTRFPFDWGPSYPQFTAGILLFVVGVIINLHSDATLRRLRRQYTSYQIPMGGLFTLVSAPHYFGELLEWAGFCMACRGSLASLSFVCFSAANLIPRAVSHHRWYHQTFAKYPANRKAVIPWIW